MLGYVKNTIYINLVIKTECGLKISMMFLCTPCFLREALLNGQSIKISSLLFQHCDNVNIDEGFS